MYPSQQPEEYTRPQVYQRQQSPYGTYNQRLEVVGNRVTKQLFASYLTIPQEPLPALTNSAIWVSVVAGVVQVTAVLPNILQATVSLVVLGTLVLPVLALREEPKLLPYVLVRTVLVILGLTIGLSL